MYLFIQLHKKYNVRMNAHVVPTWYFICIHILLELLNHILMKRKPKLSEFSKVLSTNSSTNYSESKMKKEKFNFWLLNRKTKRACL